MDGSLPSYAREIRFIRRPKCSSELPEVLHIGSETPPEDKEWYSVGEFNLLNETGVEQVQYICTVETHYQILVFYQGRIWKKMNREDDLEIERLNKMASAGIRHLIIKALRKRGYTVDYCPREKQQD